MLIQPHLLNICIMPSHRYMLTETFFLLMWFHFLQGTVLDRIDFNVEQACVKTEDGLKQLQKVNPNGSCVSTNKVYRKLTFHPFSEGVAGVLSKTFAF